ncbi:IS3 family transposase [Mangrovivirga cuniculi]|uniref:IS3 family transposase n=1 Tax=Mangrovivirga cuniculi TaxID=2715131 RepID=UPI001FE6D02C|nr:IS3 family transposase [Mangrovivirga cuniculi]
MFGKSRQVYYRAKKSEAKRRETASVVVKKVQQVRMRMSELGTRKLYEKLYDELRELGVGRDRLFAIMKANHMQILPKRQYHITTDSHHRFRKHRNLVENLTLNRPEQLWVSDITYIGNRQNPMYLSLVTDAYSKKIMGFNVSNSLHAQGAIKALKQAIKNRKYYDRELIHHSDRGLQYCCDDYQKELDKGNLLCSMTEKYDPYQNAIAERVNGILKQEFIKGILVNDIVLMNKLIKQSIDIYNRERPHYSCYMKTPEFMHGQEKIKIRTYKKIAPQNCAMLLNYLSL